MLLKQSTAVNVNMGPFVDSSYAPNTGLTIAAADIQLSKNAAAFAQTSGSSNATHLYQGDYQVPLTVVDTGTLGHLRARIHKANYQPVVRDFLVVPSYIYDYIVQGTPVVADQLPDENHTWRFEAPDALTATNIIYETVGFDATLAMRLHEAILDQNSIQSVTVVAYPGVGLAISAEVSMSQQEVVIPAVATVAGEYIVVATFTKIDGQVILRRGIAIIQTATGT
jgi:hypothetical protein